MQRANALLFMPQALRNRMLGILVLLTALLLVPSHASAEPEECRQKLEASLLEAMSLPAFLEQDGKCLEATDNCSLCKRKEDGKITCSTPGINCIQTDNHCTKRATSAQ